MNVCVNVIGIVNQTLRVTATIHIKTPTHPRTLRPPLHLPVQPLAAREEGLQLGDLSMCK